MEWISLDGMFMIALLVILFIIYYKVFRIAYDVKEIKELLKSSEIKKDTLSKTD